MVYSGWCELFIMYLSWLYWWNPILYCPLPPHLPCLLLLVPYNGDPVVFMDILVQCKLVSFYIHINNMALLIESWLSCKCFKVLLVKRGYNVWASNFFRWCFALINHSVTPFLTFVFHIVFALPPAMLFVDVWNIQDLQQLLNQAFQVLCFESQGSLRWQAQHHFFLKEDLRYH